MGKSFIFIRHTERLFQSFRHKKHLSDSCGLIYSGNTLFDSKGTQGNPSPMDPLDKPRVSYMPVWKKKRSLDITEAGLTNIK